MMKDCKGTSYGRLMLIMAAGMLIASIPGILLAPYSVNYFDEPYQILNAYDWQNAVYSPLSSWIAHYYGELVHWKYLGFRYLAVGIHYVSLLICGAYALRNTRYPIRIILVTWIVTLLMMTDKAPHFLYGWDAWTEVILSATVVLWIYFVRTGKYYVLLLIMLSSAVASLFRLPNSCIVLFGAFLTSIYFSIKKVGIGRSVLNGLVFAAITMGFIAAFLTLLYGSVSTYLDTLSQNTIGEHSLSDMVVPFIKGFCCCAGFAGLLYVLYLAVKKIYRCINLGWVFALILIFVFLVTVGVVKYNFRINGMVIGIDFILMYVIIRKSIAKKNLKSILIIILIFLIGSVPSLGSNCGFYKSLSWTVLPLLISMTDNIKPGRVVKILSVSLAVAFVVIRVAMLRVPTFEDDSVFKLSARIENSEIVLDGMVTNSRRKETITKLTSFLKPYEEEEYAIIPLRAGNDYMWEYMTLHWNPYQRHNFGNWYAFWDKEYVENVINEIKSSGKPTVVMYMQWRDDDNPSVMFTRLGEEMKCIADEPGYSLWEYRP